MENRTIASQDARNLAAFFILACAISWAIEIPLALAERGIIRPIIPSGFHYFLSYGPMLAAVIITGMTEGRRGLFEIWKRLTQWRVGGTWWLAALSPLIVALIIVLAMNLFTGQKFSISELGMIPYLPPLGLGALLLWILTSGIGEETGWRGYALPHLQKNHNALYATTILTIFWALWHLPLFFYLFDPSIAVGWLLGLFAAAIVFTWLLNSAEGSILIVAIFHGCFNFISSSNGGNGLLAIVVSILVMVWAVAIVFLYKPKTLSRKGRFVSVTSRAHTPIGYQNENFA